jgi:tyrosine-protein kinase Etk/Wzc
VNNHHFETRITTPSVLAERPAHAGELEFDFRELWDFLWSGRWLILAVAGGVTVLGAAYALLATPVYRTDGLIQVEEDRQGLASLSELSSVLGATPVQTPAEISILRSRMVIRAVVDKLGLRTAAEPEYFPLLGRTIARWTGGADSDQPAPPLLGLGSYAWGGERIVVRDFNVPRGLEDQQFEIVAAAAGGYELWSPDGDRLGAGKAGERLNAQAYGQPLSVFVQELVARPGTRFALTRYGWSTILRDIDDRLTVQEQTKDSGIIQVQFQDRDPQRAADFVDALQTGIRTAERGSAFGGGAAVAGVPARATADDPAEARRGPAAAQRVPDAPRVGGREEGDRTGARSGRGIGDAAAATGAAARCSESALYRAAPGHGGAQ